MHVHTQHYQHAYSQVCWCVLWSSLPHTYAEFCPHSLPSVCPVKALCSGVCYMWCDLVWYCRMCDMTGCHLCAGGADNVRYAGPEPWGLRATGGAEERTRRALEDGEGQVESCSEGGCGVVWWWQAGCHVQTHEWEYVCGSCTVAGSVLPILQLSGDTYWILNGLLTRNYVGLKGLFVPACGQLVCTRIFSSWAFTMSNMHTSLEHRQALSVLCA